MKGGLRLSALGTTYTGDRLMGAAVSLIENPNGFAYMMCVFLPLYLYAYQQAPKKWQKWAFLACALAAVWICTSTDSCRLGCGQGFQSAERPAQRVLQPI